MSVLLIVGPKRTLAAECMPTGQTDRQTDRPTDEWTLDRHITLSALDAVSVTSSLAVTKKACYASVQSSVITSDR